MLCFRRLIRFESIFRAVNDCFLLVFFGSYLRLIRVRHVWLLICLQMPKSAVVDTKTLPHYYQNTLYEQISTNCFHLRKNGVIVPCR